LFGIEAGKIERRKKITMGEVYLKLEELVEKANANPSFRKKVKGWDRVISFRITGDQEESCLITTKDGEVSLEKGDVSNLDIIVTTNIESFNEIVKGSLKPSSAFLSGRLKVEGPLFDLIKLNSVFKILL
jgi:putative sterol carrier protein